MVDIQEIEDFISKYYDENIVSKLSDENLMSVYMTHKSFKKLYSIQDKILQKYIIDEEQRKECLSSVMHYMVAPGLKGQVRGYQFNKLVEEILTCQYGNNDDYDVKFEKRPTLDISIQEIPDWYVHNKTNNKIIVGYNQIDLWSGGEQTNRGGKYVLDDNLHRHEDLMFLSVVCRKPEKKFTRKSKVFCLFKEGIEKERLCFPSNLCALIKQKLD